MQVGNFFLLSYPFDLLVGFLVWKRETFSTEVTCFLAVEAESFLDTTLPFIGSEFPNMDNINIHSIGIFGFQGAGIKGLVGVLCRALISFEDFFSSLPLGLEVDSFGVLFLDGGGHSIHQHDASH